MKVKFHNKLEININGENKFVCYNTVLDSLFAKLCALEPYFTHFAFGSGKVQADPRTTVKLSNYLFSLEAQTDEIQCDPSAGVMYIRKSATIPSNDTAEIVFSEIGICASGEDNPDIYNHILITDQNGQAVDVVCGAGESLEVKLTIFLELASLDTTGYLTAGDNNLVRMLLGGDVEENKLYAVRGTNLSSNTQIKRSTPRYNRKYEAVISGANGDTVFEFQAEAKLGEGECREIVLLNSNQAVARVNTMEMLEAVSETQTLTSSSYGTIFVGDDIKEITSIVDKDGIALTDYMVKKHAKSFGDYVAFDEFERFDASVPCFTSIDGRLIAFVSGDSLHLYRCIDFGLEAIQTGAVSALGITKICMVNNAVFVIRNVSPYIELYKIVSGVLQKQTIYMENYNSSSYSYDFSDVCAVELASGKYLLGVITSDSKTGLGLKFSYTASGYILEEIMNTSFAVTDKLIALAKDDDFDAKILFITKTHANPLIIFALCEMGESVSEEGRYSESQEIMDAANASGHGRYVALKTNASPYARFYNTSDWTRYSVPVGTMAGLVSVSYDLGYMLAKNTNDEYMLFNSLALENLEQIDFNIIDEIGLDGVVDIIFMESVMVVRTADKVIALALSNNNTAVLNLESNSDYVVSFKKFSLLGNSEYEGVKVNLNILFSKEV